MPDVAIFTSLINSYLPEPHASLLNGILFGVKLKMTAGFYQQLKNVGLLHIVVLSGMNITLLSALIAYLTRSVGKHLSLLMTMLAIILFIIFVRPQAPIVRAGLMGMLTSVAIIYGRPQIGLYFLLVSAVIIGLVWPQWLTSISFQLSYGATLGILLFSPKKHQKARTRIDALSQWVWHDLAISFSAQILTAPLIFVYFKQVSLIALLSNLLVSFLIGPLMVVGFLTAALGKLNWYLGLLPSYLAYGMLSYVVFVVQTLAKIPFGYFSF